MSSSIRNKLRSLALWTLVAGASGCAAPSATGFLLAESRPIVQRYEGRRADVANLAKPGGAGIRKGGCAVCAW